MSTSVPIFGERVGRLGGIEDKKRIVAFLGFTTAGKRLRMSELWSRRARGPL
jgi:hypothetical protein